MTVPVDVLPVGFDPKTVPGVDSEMVELAIAMGHKRLEEDGFAADQVLVAPDDPDKEQKIVDALGAKPYACVVVGGGIRKEESMLELFERVINLIRRHAPQAGIAFNTNPTDSADAARRVLSEPSMGTSGR